MMSKERQKHKILEELYGLSQKIISKLKISQQNIKYYADLATYYNARDLSKLNYSQSDLYILCYVSIKYQAVNDNLVEALRYNTKKIDAGIRAKVKKQFQEEKAEVENKRIGNSRVRARLSSALEQTKKKNDYESEEAQALIEKYK